VVAADRPPRTMLVTGAGGFVGRHVVARRLRQGQGVATLSRAEAAQGEPEEQAGIDRRRLPPDGTPAPGLFEGVTAVIHTAGLAHQPDATPSEHDRVNRRFAVETAEAAAEAGVRRFVFVSTVAVHGLSESDRPVGPDTPVAPKSAYGAAKLAAERDLSELAERTGLELVIVRPALVCGPHAPGNPAKLARAIAAGLPLPLGRLNNRRSLIDVDDLAELLLRCADRDAAAGRTYMAGDPETLSTTEIVTEIATGLEQPARLLPCPTRALRLLGALAGRGRTIRQLTGSLTLDVQACIDELGWTPVLGVRASLAALGARQRASTTHRSRG
jgi:nucleoside-diphosphate-sugar epimerase